MSGSGNNRRKILIINPKLQKRMILTMSLVPAIALSLMMALVCYFCYQVYEQAVDLGIRFDGLMQLFFSVSGFVIVAAVFMLSSALMTSHRVAGPAYRLIQSLKQIREGDVAFQIKLRTGDYLTEIADELNILLNVLNENPPSGFKTRAMQAAASEHDDDPQDGDLDATPDSQVDESELTSCGATAKSE